MIKQKFAFLVGLILVINQIVTAQINVKSEFDFAQKQYAGMLATHPDYTQFPQSTKKDGSPDNRKSWWWCSGFFGGSLWYIYENTNNPTFKEAAHNWTMAVEPEKKNTSTHDLGFMLYCPFGNGYRLTQNPVYKEVMLEGAKSLATRFDPKVGLIKSWDRMGNYNYPVIIDNMMNLEFLTWVAANGGDASLKNIAKIHSDNTLKHHFRPDYSSYHVVCYNNDGTVQDKKTHQGAADNSSWARGQAWALYGYTTMYRDFNDKAYLAQAQGVANYIINNASIPTDKIPYWDYTKIGEERDASAAAITASALLELCEFVPKKTKKQYFAYATSVLESLSKAPYKAELGTNNHFILKHSVGHKPAGTEINTPIVYADYYYLEALTRYSKLLKK